MPWTRSTGKINEVWPSKEERALKKPSKKYARPRDHPDFVRIEVSLRENPPQTGYSRCNVCFCDFQHHLVRKGEKNKTTRRVCHPCANKLARINLGMPSAEERGCYKCKKLKPSRDFDIIGPIPLNSRICAECRDKDHKYSYVTEPDRLALIKLAGKCKFGGCERTESLCVDHCHSTGRIRGVLCRPHNIAMGILGDDAQAAEHMREYLDQAPV